MSDAAPPAGLCLADLTVRVPGHAAPVLRGVRLSQSPGAVSGLLGRSGAGKTTLLHAVSGLLPWLRPGRVEGSIELDGETIEDLDPGQRSSLLASCLDRPVAQLFLATPREEMDAARRLYGETPLLEPALSRLDLRRLLDRRTLELSSGERQRLALAIALAGCPRPVLLDEPTAHLDGEACAALAGLLEAASELGGSVLLTEQAGWRLGRSVSRWRRVEEGRLHPGGAPAAPKLPAPDHPPRDVTAVRLRGVTVQREGRDLLRHVDLALRAGEIVLVSGPNGVGKSTLAEVVAGYRRPASGGVESNGAVTLMLPFAELQLFAASVAAEIGAGHDRELQARVLRRHRLQHLAARAPWTLSRGEQQRLVHAALDLQRPAAMVVDEPAQGLDPHELAELVSMIQRRAERGRAYLLISHREELAAAAHRHLRVAEGRLVPC